jgi:hypothetical protein
MIYEHRIDLQPTWCDHAPAVHAWRIASEDRSLVIAFHWEVNIEIQLRSPSHGANAWIATAF